MPQASDEQRSKWGGFQGVGEDKAYLHLKENGFRFENGFVLPPVGGYDFDDDPTDCWGAVEFLCDEWDYGYLPNVHS